MTAPGKVLVVSGPAGVGKSTVCQRLVATGRFVRSVSATTRLPRGDERDGVHYHFLGLQEFERRRDAGEFLEWARVHETKFYGTPARFVLDALAQGKHVLLDIDVQGAEQLRRKGLPVTSVFLLPPPPYLETLRRRLEGRRDTSPEDIERRLRTAEREIPESARYDVRIVNEDVERTVAEIERFLAGRPDAAK